MKKEVNKLREKLQQTDADLRAALGSDGKDDAVKKMETRMKNMEYSKDSKITVSDERVRETRLRMSKGTTKADRMATIYHHQIRNRSEERPGGRGLTVADQIIEVR